MEETERTGELVYNALFDPHLNQRGSRVVGLELARVLQAQRTAELASPHPKEPVERYLED